MNRRCYCVMYIANMSLLCRIHHVEYFEEYRKNGYLGFNRIIFRLFLQIFVSNVTILSSVPLNGIFQLLTHICFGLKGYSFSYLCICVLFIKYYNISRYIRAKYFLIFSQATLFFCIPKWLSNSQWKCHFKLKNR